MSEDDRWFIDSLSDRNKLDADVSSSMDVLEVLLSVEALPALVKLIGDTSRSISLRERAARAIKTIGAEYVAEELVTLEQDKCEDIRRCANIALGR